MPKYRLSAVEVTTLLDALEDAIQYRSIAAGVDHSPHHREVANRYQDLLNAVEPVTIDRITVRYTWGVKTGMWEVRQQDDSVYGTYVDWDDANEAAEALIADTDEYVTLAFVN
jgi:hypothetical protein